MPSSLLQSVDFSNGHLIIKFNYSVDVSTLVNAHFDLTTDLDAATPTIIADPFQTIDLSRDYNSIARLLNLWFNDGVLVASTEYELDINNLKTVAGGAIAAEGVNFTTGTSVAPDDVDIPPSEAPPTVVDLSIRQTGTVDFDELVLAGSDEFYVVSVKPDVEVSYYLPADYNEGRIEIVFNQPPAANYVSPQYFKVQRKLLSTAPSRWETVAALVGSEPLLNIVFVYMPSNDATPVYATPDKVYYEDNYKYRLRISSLVGI